MPNLAGIYDLRRDSTEIAATLAEMARVLAVPAVGYTIRSAVGRRAGCVNLLRGATSNLSQPVHDESEGLWLMLDGEVYNVDEIRRWLGRQGASWAGLDDAGLCLALYKLEGEAFVSRLSGQFNLVIYREADCSLLLATDRYGYRPLFVAESDSRLLFAVEMKAIVAVLEKAPEPDGIGLLQILREGIALGDHTWLDPIRVLDPGTILHATPDGIRRRRYFKYRFREGGNVMSAAAFVDGFAVKLHRATERVMKGPGRIGISLSGGLDSRSVLLSMHPSHLPITAYTFGYPQSRDVVYARLLAELLGLPHFHLLFEPGYLSRVISAVVWRNEALFPFASSTSICFHNRIADHMDIILNGHCGDALTGSHIRPHMMAGRSRDKLIERMFRARQLVPEENLRLIFNPRFYSRHAPNLFDAMRATFTDIDNEEIPNLADAWDMENRQRRGTFHSPSVDRYRFEQRTPFLDNELVDHLLTAPPRWRFQQQAYKKMIVQAFPHASHVPWAYTGNRLSPYFAVELARIAWNYGHNRTSSLLSGLSRNGQLVGQEFRDLQAEFRGDYQIARRILEFTDSPSFPGDVFDGRGVKEIVRRHWEAREDHTHLVASLATFATAYQLFLLDRPSILPADRERLVCT